MHRLMALKDYLEGLGHWNPERIDATIEDGLGEWTNSGTGPDLLLFRHTYTGVIELDAA